MYKRLFEKKVKKRQCNYVFYGKNANFAVIETPYVEKPNDYLHI